jgi:hypothetical protein
MPGLSSGFGSSTSIVVLKVPGRGIERRADALDAAGEVRPGERVDDDRHSLLGPQLRELALRHVHLGDQRIEIGDLEGAVVDVDGVAHLDVAGGDHAGDRRADLRIAEVELRQVARGLQPLHFGAALSTAERRRACG